MPLPHPITLHTPQGPPGGYPPQQGQLQRPTYHHGPGPAPDQGPYRGPALGPGPGSQAHRAAGPPAVPAHRRFASKCAAAVRVYKVSQMCSVLAVKLFAMCTDLFHKCAPLWACYAHPSCTPIVLPCLSVLLFEAGLLCLCLEVLLWVQHAGITCLPAPVAKHIMMVSLRMQPSRLAKAGLRSVVVNAHSQQCDVLHV